MSECRAETAGIPNADQQRRDACDSLTKERGPRGGDGGGDHRGAQGNKKGKGKGWHLGVSIGCPVPFDVMLLLCMQLPMDPTHFLLLSLFYLSLLFADRIRGSSSSPTASSKLCLFSSCSPSL